MSTNRRHIFHGLQVLLADKWEQQAVVVVEGKINAIIPPHMIQHHLPAHEHHFPADYYLIPGLIDLHVHGAAGADVMDATPQALQTISRALAQEGVTGFLATTLTASRANIRAAVANVAASDDPAILGVHLEGPFLAAEKAGAQHPQHLLLPDASLFKSWQACANGAIKLVTLAPELSGAYDFIAQLHEQGIVVALGHTNATFAQTEQGIAKGASYATHLFNAMRMITQREPGASGALLLNDQVTAELIVDHYHLHPAMVELALRVKGVERLVLVSDAMRAKCLPDGHYQLGELAVQVVAGKATLADGRLAGSTLRLPEALRFIAEHRLGGLSAAIKMASLNPAKIVGLAERKGSITVAKDADLVVLNKELQVQLTMRGGEIVFAQ
jgi:N-acetylglucosamine-6-phosphate deacetylase